MREVTETGRPSATLTSAQRRYLREKDLTGADERAMRSRIRNRLHASVQDFELLVNELPDEELSKLFEADHPYWALITYLYLLARAEDLTILADTVPAPGSDGDDRPAGWLGAITSNGIEEAILCREGRPSEVEVSIEVDRSAPLDELAQQDLSKLPRNQLDRLWVNGYISDKEYDEANRQRIERLASNEAYNELFGGEEPAEGPE